MISTDHTDAYLKAMEKRDVASAKIHMADDVFIYSPLVPAPFKEKNEVADVLTALLSTVDASERKMSLRNNADFVAAFTSKLGDHTIDGIDHMHINEAGFVDSMPVASRPLPSAVAVHHKLAPKPGGKAMKPVNLD